MSIIFHKETPSDYREVETLICETFWNVYRPGYLDGITGVYTSPQGYLLDEDACEAIDKQILLKGKRKLPGQLV